MQSLLRLCRNGVYVFRASNQLYFIVLETMTSQLRGNKSEKLIENASHENSAKISVMDQQPWRLGSILESGLLVLRRFFVPERTG